MKKQELLKFIDEELLDKLFEFCYARTKDSYEAEDLCSDIVYALIKAAKSEGEISEVYAFIWRVARNVYADFSKKRRKELDVAYEGAPEDILETLPAIEEADDSDELLTAVYRRIAFLTRIYREVMIMFYLDGLSASEIAKKQGVSETTVRQRLFSARKKIKDEVEEMNETYNKPVALGDVDFVIWGTGNPCYNDPRSTLTRKFSKHIVWLCNKKPMSASEIATELNVPTVYVEEELEILRKGENGEYGFLRRLDNGKYAINIILFDKETLDAANKLYAQRLPQITDVIIDFIEEHKAEYLAYPYLNKKLDMNLIIWQQISNIARSFSHCVERNLREKHFASVTEKAKRPFYVFAYEANGKLYGGGWDGIYAENLCGYSRVRADNIYVTRIAKHFHCGHNMSTDPELQLALRAIDGLEISTLTEQEKEHAAKAIECGYLYKDGETLYTKILVSDLADKEDLFKITAKLYNGYFDTEAEIVAENIAKLIKSSVPEYLLGEWGFANDLANMPVLDAVIESLIEKGIITAPENRIGAEGCWISVAR